MDCSCVNRTFLFSFRIFTTKNIVQILKTSIGKLSHFSAFAKFTRNTRVFLPSYITWSYRSNMYRVQWLELAMPRLDCMIF